MSLDHKACSWHDANSPRESFPVPSIHHETLLSKAVFEHGLDYAQVATIGLASKSIQNSSLSPNFAYNIVVNVASVVLFNTVFHPTSSLPLQFVPGLELIYEPDQEKTPRYSRVTSFVE